MLSNNSIRSQKSATLARTLVISMSLFCFAACDGTAAVDTAEEVKDTSAPPSDSDRPLISTESKTTDSEKTSHGSSPETEYTIWKRCSGKPNIQCLHSNAQYSASELTNKTGYNVSFRIDEYHSHCGFPGFLVSKRWYTISTSGVMNIDFSPYTGFGCREQWIVDCKLEGFIPVQCSDVIGAWMWTDFR